MHHASAVAPEDAGGNSDKQQQLKGPTGGRPRPAQEGWQLAQPLLGRRSGSTKNRDCTLKVLWMRQENSECVDGHA